MNCKTISLLSNHEKPILKVKSMIVIRFSLVLNIQIGNLVSEAPASCVPMNQ